MREETNQFRKNRHNKENQKKEKQKNHIYDCRDKSKCIKKHDDCVNIKLPKQIDLV